LRSNPKKEIFFPSSVTSNLSVRAMFCLTSAATFEVDQPLTYTTFPPGSDLISNLLFLLPSPSVARFTFI
jgi:hypothetical protein